MDENKEESPETKKKKKNAKKKNQKYKKKQAEKMKKMGMREEDIKKALEKLSINTKNEKKETVNDISDDEDIQIDDLIERPKIQSVPKFAYDHELEEETTDFDLTDYSKRLQLYLREKSKLIHDPEYREDIIKKKKLLDKSIISDSEKVNIMKNDRGKKRGPGLNENVRVKIVDLGNACWFHHHFSTEIQTRQYRSPEVILGINYGASADMWSLACMIFELITGDFLFEPRKGETYSKNDDHLAQIIELLGKMPSKMALSGKFSKKYFTKYGSLKRVKGLQFWPLRNVLMEKYKFKESEARALEDFLMPMLEYHPERRATAQDMLRHEWLNMEPNFDYLLTEKEYEKKNMSKKNKFSNKDEYNEYDVIESDIEQNVADDEDNEDYMTDDIDEDDDNADDADLVTIQNFNNSFAAYGQHVNLAALDRANPQFQKK